MDGRAEGSIGRRQRDQAVTVHGLQTNIETPAGRLDHLRQEKTGVVIRDDDGRVSGQALEEAAAFVARSLDVGVVPHGGIGKRGVIGPHAVNDEPMQPVGGPRVVHAQRLENDDLCRVPGPMHAAIERS